MKPRTRLQFEVLKLTEDLPDIEGKILSWAKVSCLKHLGYATKNRVICMDCGQKFPTSLVSRKRAICPHCATKLSIIETRDRTLKQNIYVASASVYNDFQVIRNFEIYSYHKADKPVKYFIHEVLQHWILSNGKREVVARNHTTNWYCDSWNGYMEIRDKKVGYYGNKYDIYPSAFHPKSKFKPEYLKIGINHNLKGLTALEAIKNVPNNPKIETLLKAKQYGLLEASDGHDYKVGNYWTSIKICMRNKYFVKDAKMWFDYLDLLSYFHKDLRNAHYVCPKDLKKVHDKLVEKKRAYQKKQDEEHKRLKDIKDEELFQQLKSQFFGLIFKDDLIQVKVLESVHEFMEEGDSMHHCVFTNSYYLKPDSLIFSATIEGKRIETVEVSIKQMKVVQSRGVCNNSTEYHDRIVSLVNSNIKNIKKRVVTKQIA